MKLVLTHRSRETLRDALMFMHREQGIPKEKIRSIKSGLLEKARTLPETYGLYQLEPLLEHLGQGHRRIVHGNFKIVYLVSGNSIYVTDFFHTHRKPSKIKG